MTMFATGGWPSEMMMAEWVFDNAGALLNQLGLELVEAKREVRSAGWAWDIVATAEDHGPVLLEIKTRAHRLPSGLVAQGRTDRAATFVWVTPEFQAADLAKVTQQGSGYRQIMEVAAIEVTAGVEDGLLTPTSRVCAPSNAIVRRLVRLGRDFEGVRHRPMALQR